MKTSRHLLPIALIALLGCCAPVWAGWLIVTNDTKHTLVVQETAGPQNRPVRGKCLKLKPGETYREFQLVPGVRNVVVYNAAAPQAALVTTKLTWGAKDSHVVFESQPKGIVLAAAVAKR